MGQESRMLKIPWLLLSGLEVFQRQTMVELTMFSSLPENKHWYVNATVLLLRFLGISLAQPQP
jgi:hypothetical protein